MSLLKNKLNALKGKTSKKSLLDIKRDSIKNRIIVEEQNKIAKEQRELREREEQRAKYKEALSKPIAESPLIAPYKSMETVPQSRLEMIKQQSGEYGPVPYKMPDDVKRKYEREKMIEEYYKDKGSYLGSEKYADESLSAVKLEQLLKNAPENIRKAVEERNQELRYQEQEPAKKQKLAFGRNLFAGATLGASDYIPYTEREKQAMEEYPNIAMAGKVAGYTMPFAGASSLSANLLKAPLGKIAGESALKFGAKEIVKQAGRKGLALGVQEGVAGAGIGVAEGLIRQESPLEVAQRGTEFGAYGLVGGGIIGSISKLGQSISQLSKYNKSALYGKTKGYEQEIMSDYQKAKSSNNIEDFNNLIEKNKRAIDGLKNNKQFGTSKESKQIIKAIEEINDQLRKERAYVGDRTNKRIPAKTDLMNKTLPKPESLLPKSKATIQPWKQKLLTEGTKQPQITESALKNQQADIMSPTPMSATKPTAQETLQVQNPLSSRTLKNVGKRDVKAYQQENEAVKGFYKPVAQYILQEEFLPAKKGNAGDFNRSIQGEVMKKLRETGLSYAKIKEGLELIVKDGGLENVARAKKVELVLDELLSKGFKTIDGQQIYADKDYLNIKSEFDGIEYKEPAKPVPEDLPILESTYAKPSKAINEVKTKLITPKKSPSKKTSSGLRVNLQTFSTSEQVLTGIKNRQKASDVDFENLPKEDTLNMLSQNDKSKTTLSEIARSGLKNIYNNFFDRDIEFKKFDELAGGDSYIKATNSKRVSGKVVDKLETGLLPILKTIPNNKILEFEDFLLNRHAISRANVEEMQGIKIENSKSEVEKYLQKYPNFKDAKSKKDIPKNQRDEYKKYLKEKDISKQKIDNKKIFEWLTKEKAQEKVNKYNQYEGFEVAAKKIDSYMDSLRKTLEKEGFISTKLSNELKEKYPNYIPTQRKFDELEKVFTSIGIGKGYVDLPTAIRKAGTSSRKIDVLKNIFNHTNKIIRIVEKNKVGRSVLEQVRKNPEESESIAELLPEDYKGRVDLDNIISVWDEGERVYLKVHNEEFLKTIKNVMKLPGNEFPKIRKISQTFKALITQYNPLFTIPNFIRDYQTAYIQGSAESFAEFNKGLFDAVKDIIQKNPVYKDYKRQGGLSSNFFSQDEYLKFVDRSIRAQGKGITPKKIWYQVIDSIDSLNNAIETIPRLAEFKRVLEDTGNIEKAFYEAGEVSVNFARGGTTAKQLESFVPYFNPSLQGADKITRGFIDVEKLLDAKNFDDFKNSFKDKRKIKDIVKKSLVAITIPTIFFELISRMADNEGYERVSDRIKDDFYLFPKGDGEFIRLPKTRGYNILFSNLLQRAIRLANGEDLGEATKGFGSSTYRSIGPVDPLKSNIASGIYNLNKNKDWADRYIIPPNLEGRSPKYQYDEKTTILAKQLGGVANISPKQIDYVMDTYTGVVGDLLLPALSLEQRGNIASRPLNIVKRKFVSDSYYSNQDITDFYDTYKELQTKVKDGKDIGVQISPIDYRMEKVFRNISKQLGKLRKLATNSKTDEKAREYQKQMSEIVKEINSKYKELKSKEKEKETYKQKN